MNSLEIYNQYSEASQSLIQRIQDIVQQYSTTTTTTTTTANSSTTGHDPPPNTISPSMDASFQEMLLLFLQLKESQRQLGWTLGGPDLSSRLQEKRNQVENEALLFQNVLYEKNHLMNSIRSCRQLDCPHLFQMARDEMDPKSIQDVEQKHGNDGVVVKEGDEGGMVVSRKDAVIDAYLAPKSISSSSSSSSSSNSADNHRYSHRDVARHSYNLSKLHAELTVRGTLHAQLLQAKKEKSALLQDLAQKKKFLASIPLHIVQLEKSLNQCREYFEKDPDLLESLGGDFSVSCLSMVQGGGDGGGGDGSSSSISADEKERNVDDEMGEKIGLEALSAPLYTLYIQIVSFIQGHGKEYHCHQWKVKLVESKPFQMMPSPQQQQQQQQQQEENNLDMDKVCNEKIFQKESKAVQLWIPVPNMNNTDTVVHQDWIKIQFEYLTILNVVLAHVVVDVAANDKSMMESSLLLQYLFPEDHGRDLPAGAASVAVYRLEGSRASSRNQEGMVGESNENKYSEDNEHYEDEWNDTCKDNYSQEETMVSAEQMSVWKIRQLFHTTSQQGRPYHWCQYLSGLHYPKETRSAIKLPQELVLQSQMDASARVILQSLYRRIRSRTVLGHLIKKLKSAPNPVPVHSSMKNIQNGSSDSALMTKLVSFQLGAKLECEHGVLYNVTLKRKSKTIKAEVKIGARYPIEPPTWSLQEATAFQEPISKKQKSFSLEMSMDGSLPLYNSSLGKIESRLNSLTDHSDFYNLENEESYDWILAHQVRHLILEWDTLQQSLEVEGVGFEERRGRDRCPSGLYELYRHEGES